MSAESIIIILLSLLVASILGFVIVFFLRKPPASQQEPITQEINNMRAELGRIYGLIQVLEKDRNTQFGEITTQLKATNEQTTALNSTTTALREALANSRARGQWGERMAEDILRAIGFTEGINYVKQTSMRGSNSRPDFTFMLPNYLKLNMDVKFPLDNYLKCVNASSAEDMTRYSKAFLRDARNRINEITTRDYIDPNMSTIGCVLLFIPNEQIFQFIQENDLRIMDDAMEKHVILCSPSTLFAILVVIRQAVENFAVNETADQIITELSQFTQQWTLFIDKLEDVGKKIDATQAAYQNLTTTRKRAMDRSLSRIASLKGSRQLSDTPALEYIPEDSEII
ncbi:MAG: recombinase RmuC [Dehalococcoidia bacterium]|nr:recombinase RmuC [Dehalococcoidia bacterium]